MARSVAILSKTRPLLDHNFIHTVLLTHFTLSGLLCGNMHNTYTSTTRIIHIAEKSYKDR